MMGMGFLRLNRMLAKHKWRRGKNEAAEGESRESAESSVGLWLAVMAVVIASVLIFAAVHTRQIL